MNRTLVIGAVFLILMTACGDEPQPGSDAPVAAPGPAAPVSEATDPIAQSHQLLYEMLPRALTAADVESVLRIAPLIESDDAQAAAKVLEDEGVSEEDWRTIRARVDMAFAQLLIGESMPEQLSKAERLRADVKVVRPFRQRLDPLYRKQR